MLAKFLFSRKSLMMSLKFKTMKKKRIRMMRITNLLIKNKRIVYYQGKKILAAEGV